MIAHLPRPWLAAALIAVLGAGRAADAGGWEIALTAGKIVPFYSQTFSYDPGPVKSPIAGVTLTQQGAFVLDASGGLAFNVALARDLGRHAALEARLDSADVSVHTTGARYRVSAPLPAPLPPLSSDVDLGTGTVDLQRLWPVSLNVKLRAGEKARVAVSGGLSWLPAFQFTVDEQVGVGLPLLTGARLALDVGRAGLRAEALPSESGQGRLGLNAGVALELPVGSSVSLVVEGRYFRFQEQTLHWGLVSTSGALSAVQEEIARQVEARLEPVVFSPSFFHVSGGIALRF